MIHVDQHGCVFPRATGTPCKFSTSFDSHCFERIFLASGCEFLVVFRVLQPHTTATNTSMPAFLSTSDAGWAHDGGFYGRNATSMRLQSNPRLFPDGMKAFCDAIHERGLKCGIYTGYAPMVCNFQNGSWGHEVVDANTFAEWGVDFVKNDWCYNAGDKYEAQAEQAFGRMRDALNATGRRMVYAIHGKQVRDTHSCTCCTVAPRCTNFTLDCS